MKEISDLIERTLAREILTYEESKHKMSSVGRAVWSGRIDGLCSALQMTKKYPIEQLFDIEWAREFKEQYRGVLEAF